MPLLYIFSRIQDRPFLLSSYCVFDIMVQGAFEKCFLLKIASNCFYFSRYIFFIIFDINTSKLSKNTKTNINLMFFSRQMHFWKALKNRSYRTLKWVLNGVRSNIPSKFMLLNLMLLNLLDFSFFLFFCAN